MIYRDNWTTEEMKQLRDYCVLRADKKDDEQLLWEALADMCELSRRLFEQRDPGNLEHPLWGIRYCYFTGLEMTQEPKENYVAYKFTFQQALTNGYLPK